MAFLIQFNLVEAIDVKSLIKKVSLMDGIDLRLLKVKDLTFHNDDVIYPGNGVYLFREGRQVVYVGKCSSMSFMERIPNHFDIRVGAYQNTLLKYICKRKFQKQVTDENLLEASRYCFEHFNLILINFTNKTKINRLETLLRNCCNPINKPRLVSAVSQTMRLIDM